MKGIEIYNIYYHLLAITTYRDCIKFRQERGDEVCWNCPITGSGIPIPRDVCGLTDPKREKKIDEHLDAIWKIINKYT